MKTLKFLLVAVLLSLNFGSCIPDDSLQENEILQTEALFTREEVEEMTGSQN